MFHSYFIIQDLKKIVISFNSLKKLCNKNLQKTPDFIKLFKWINKINIEKILSDFNQLRVLFKQTLAQFKHNNLYDTVCSDINVKEIVNIKFDSLKFYHVDYFSNLINNFEQIRPIILSFDNLQDLTLNLNLKLQNLQFEYDYKVEYDLKNFIKKYNLNLVYHMCKTYNYQNMFYNQQERFKIRANFMDIRFMFYDVKNNFINNCIPLDNPYGLTNKKHAIMTHIMDGAIHMVCSSYNSMITNYCNKNIFKYRLRKIKDNKNNKIMCIEQQYYKNKSICYSVFGKFKFSCKDRLCREFNLGKEYYSPSGRRSCKCKKDTIFEDLSFLIDNGTDSKVRYDKEKDEYILLITKNESTKTINNRKKIVSIDPGVRTFLTCITDNEVMKIVQKNKIVDEKPVFNKIYSRVKELRNLKTIKNKKEMTYKTARKERKIKNLVERCHWNIINYLTKNYDTILIGNMSTKSVISTTKRNGFELTDQDKDYLQRLSLFKLRARLGEKCVARKVNYYVVNEYCTSMTCSVCGEIDRNLGGKKRYDCKSCSISMDRDVNGCRNIYARSMMS